MKYLILIIILTISIFADDLNDNLKIKLDVSDLGNYTTTTLKFETSEGKLTGKYDCIFLKDLISNNDNYTIEFISETGRISIKTDIEKFNKYFYPIYIIGKNNTENIYKMQIRDKGLNEFEMKKLDKEIDKTVDKIVQINSKSNEFESNSMIFIDKNNEFIIYKNIKEIILYKHI